MAYTVINFKTKKAFKEAVKNYLDNHDGVKSSYGSVSCFQPGLGPDLSNYTGTVYLEGPHAPAAHTWYAMAQLVNGIVVKVK